MKKSAAPHPHETRPTSLKMLAAYLNLSPSTISYVLNDSPGRSIPTATRDRVKAAAAKFNYRPSMIARTLQGKRMQTIGVLLPELGEGYHSQVLSGVGDLLIREGYFYFTGSPPAQKGPDLGLSRSSAVPGCRRHPGNRHAFGLCHSLQSW